VQRDMIPRQHAIVWHATVARARSFPLAVGTPLPLRGARRLRARQRRARPALPSSVRTIA